MEYKKIKIERTARYILLGELSSKTKNIWVCFHGYGQLASFFSSKFKSFVNEETCIFVPEGLSRFYLHGKYERIGASWITKEMREEEVEDYLNYLNEVFEKETADIDLSKIKLNVLGFSQGCTTACRWLNQLELKASNLLLWAGYFPNGIEEIIKPTKLNLTNNYYVYGDDDVFLKNEPKMAVKMKENLAESINAKFVEFSGGHKIDRAVLHNVFGEIQKL